VVAALSILLMTTPPDFARLGDETLAMIQERYFLPDRNLYAERPDRKQPAFNWGVGVMLSALNAAAKHDKKYLPSLRAYANATRLYWNDGGYDVLPAPKSKDRYYDDNAWMALAFVETYEILGDRKYLDWANDALNFALKGEAPDGGIYWRETDRASRNTCSCAPTAAACLAIYSITKDPKLKAKAENLFAWTEKHLMDPQDSLMWDALGNDGKLHQMKWSYNTALMIRTGHDLQRPLAQKMRDAARKHWIKEGRIADPGRFAHLLLEALLRSGAPRKELEAAVLAVHAAKTKEGFLPGHWHNLKTESNPEILDQAAFARACFVLASK